MSTISWSVVLSISRFPSHTEGQISRSYWKSWALFAIISAEYIFLPHRHKHWECWLHFSLCCLLCPGQFGQFHWWCFQSKWTWTLFQQLPHEVPMVFVVSTQFASPLFSACWFWALPDNQPLVILGDPKSRNDRTAEWQNHGITERRKMTPNPKRRNPGMAERRKITPNPKRRNRGTAEWQKIPRNPKRRSDGKYHEILKDGMTENAPKS